ncbi:MAG: T9SS type A sorting domain-containing protein [Bacteroidetes bacterium]|nr:T9SS type A sorting domain-containing protein [Bacteroidota bacterium]
MKRLLLTCLLSISLFCHAQTTITASYSTTTTTFSTGITYITFAIRNNNVFPVTLTNLTSLQANLYENNIYTLWYSASSLFGAPAVSAPAWIPVTTSLQPFTSSVIGQVTPFNCIGLVIPPSTTYRFALQGSKGTAVRGASTPNIFSNGGVDLLTGDNTSTGGQVGYFGWQTLGNAAAAYFFDGSITFAPSGAFTDLQVLSITKPTTACATTSNSLQAQICNKSPNTINLATANTTVNFNITGPMPQTASVVLSGGTLAPCGCISAVVGGINFSLPGNYYISATANVTGAVDANLANNTFLDSITNYKPTLSTLIDSVCQFTSGPLFAGFTGFNCLSRNRTYTLNALVMSSPPIDGSNDATAGLFGQSALPGLPAGAVITGGKLVISNLNCQPTGSFGDQARFSIYSPSIGTAAPFLPGQNGNPLSFSVYNFDYAVNISAAQLNAMYTSIGVGGIFNIGYWESIDNVVGSSDILLNAQGQLTQATLSINYTISPNVKWFTSASGGNSFYTGSTMNPFVIPSSGLSSTSTIGNYTFYATCSADTVCRLPVLLKIKPSPAVVQDSLASCELISSTGNGLFDLTLLNNSVSASNPLATVSYYQDLGLSLLISNPTNYISNSTYIYSKVAEGSCFSSDTVYLQVHQKPMFSAPLVSGSACLPDYIDAASLIDPFSFVTPGTDTLYYDDIGLTTLHPNPHAITAVDTVYIVFETNTTPACYDTSTAQINVMPANHFIVNQDTVLNFSYSGSIGCANLLLSDGINDTLYSTYNCSRIASITDYANGISLGSTSICEEIEPSVLLHNGQPYVNRHYTITPSVQDTANVCLYYLDDDLEQYNVAALLNGWPLLPTAANPTLVSNLCFTRVSNGNLNTLGHIAEVIPNTAISSNYNPLTTVWTFCFMTDSFENFYLHAQNPFNIPLPIDIVNFSGVRQGESNLLSWQTKDEKEIHYFEVERSVDGKNFQSISEKILGKYAQSNTQNSFDYSFVDFAPSASHSYYRLKNQDIDGQIAYSQVIDIFRDPRFVIHTYPNPVSNELHIDIQSALEQTQSKIKIYDVTGRVVHAVAFDLMEGSNQLTIDISRLISGIYQLVINTNGQFNYTETISKQSN